MIFKKKFPNHISWGTGTNIFTYSIYSFDRVILRSQCSLRFRLSREENIWRDFTARVGYLQLSFVTRFGYLSNSSRKAGNLLHTSLLDSIWCNAHFTCCFTKKMKFTNTREMPLPLQQHANCNCIQSKQCYFFIA